MIQGSLLSYKYHDIIHMFKRDGACIMTLWFFVILYSLFSSLKCPVNVGCWIGPLLLLCQFSCSRVSVTFSILSLKRGRCSTILWREVVAQQLVNLNYLNQLDLVGSTIMVGCAFLLSIFFPGVLSYIILIWG